MGGGGTAVQQPHKAFQYHAVGSFRLHLDTSPRKVTDTSARNRQPVRGMHRPRPEADALNASTHQSVQSCHAFLRHRCYFFFGALSAMVTLIILSRNAIFSATSCP